MQLQLMRIDIRMRINLPYEFKWIADRLDSVSCVNADQSGSTA